MSGGRTALLALGALLGACSPSARDAEREAPRVVIVGIDGWDWNIVDPLVEAGRMPVMERLQEQGTRADLLTLVPLEKSPVIWTTIATGRLPSAPGRGFVQPDTTDGPRRTYTSWHRTTRAFWNILTEEGIGVGVLGWLETWPAEPVQGSMVTDYVKYFREQARTGPVERATYPDSLSAVVDPLVVAPEDVTDADLRPLVGADLPPEQSTDVLRGLSTLRWILAGDRTFVAVGREFLRNRHEDVMAIYLRGPDAVCHQFWGDREQLAAGTKGALVELFGSTVDRYFVETDRMLGQLLEEIDLEQTSLLLLSDHGFQGARRGLDGSLRQGIYMHREIGTALVAGPWAAGEGIRADGARVQDVLPTLLHALDLPVARDLDGEAALWLLGPAGGSERAIRWIPTYERGPIGRPDEEPVSPVSEVIRERTEALGYVD